MLIVVKPGWVLISLRKMRPVFRLSSRSTRAMPAPSMARNAAIASRWTSAVCPGVSTAGMTISELSSRYLAS